MVQAEDGYYGTESLGCQRAEHHQPLRGQHLISVTLRGDIVNGAAGCTTDKLADIRPFQFRGLNKIQVRVYSVTIISLR